MGYTGDRKAGKPRLVTMGSHCCLGDRGHVKYFQSSGTVAIVGTIQEEWSRYKGRKRSASKE